MTGEFFKSKKGSYSDAIFFVIAIFVVGLVSVIGLTLFNQLNEQFTDSNSGLSPEGQAMFSSIHGKYVDIQEGAFIFIFVGLLLAIVIGAWFIRSHPALFWISIPIMAFIIWLGAIYSNFFNAFTSTSDFSAATAQFTIIPFFLNNYVYFITGVVLLLSIALFAKNRLIDNDQ